MKRWLLIALLCVLSPLGIRAQQCASGSSGSGSVTVSGNLKDAGGSNVTTQNSWARFTLAGYGGNIPRVTGTNVIAVACKDFKPDANGNISGNIQGNDTITIGGASQPGGTSYQICIFVQGQSFRCGNFTIIGSFFNINNATPNTTTPTIPPPTGDNTYLRLDAGNGPLGGPLAVPELDIAGSGTALVMPNTAFGGPSPWFDVTGNGSNCAGSDSTTATQNLFTIALTIPGANIYEPPGCAGVSVVSINAASANFLNITGGGGTFSPNYSLKFTDTCSSAPCFQTQNSSDLRFSDGVLGFPNCTTTPCWSNKGTSGGSRNSFHHLGIVGPGLSGPTLMDLDSLTFGLFDDWSFCQTASVCFNGGTGADPFSDNVVFRNFSAYNIGTAAFQNLAVLASIEDSSLGLCNANNHYAKALQYSGYTGMQGLLLSNVAVVGGPGSGCNDTLAFWNTPNVTAGQGFGGINVIGGITIGDGNQTAFSIGNNGLANIIGHDFANLAVGVQVGTGVTLNLLAPNCQGAVSSVVSGTPVNGIVQDCSGDTTFYGTTRFPNGPVAFGVAAGLAGTGACSTIATQVGGAWGGSAKCTGTTGASTLTITPGTTAPNGWICSVQDETTRANLFQQTSHTPTTCVLTVTSVTQNDVFVFTAIAF